MAVYETIQNVALILDKRLTPLPIVYEHTITTYMYDTLDTIVKHQIVKLDNTFKYIQTKTKSDVISIIEEIEIRTTKDVYDVFYRFVKDSYYDSPILYYGLERLSEDYIGFEVNYNKKPGYFYMGIYKYNNSNKLTRIYVKRIKQDDKYGPHNEYVEEEHL